MQYTSNTTQAKVFVIGQTTLDSGALDDYLESIGASPAARQMIQHRELTNGDFERLTEAYGRLCYKSWEPGLNPNVTKIREDVATYLHNLIESGHGSVLEHITINFTFHDVSRILTHELVRHRVGTAFSQESMRYVRLDTSMEIRRTPYIPDEWRVRLMAKVLNLMQEVEACAAAIIPDDMKFDMKKKITSDLRSFIPMGVLTEMGFSANVRTLRHLIEQRTAPGAEHEIRELFSLVATACLDIAPILFADFECKEDGSWVPLYSKV